ncbi:hypothetical protein N9K07_01635 [Arenitalea sp.]|nr:hypothetical protein [Algibacter sp.]MDA9069438.1 hypothetical protein [Algibacter sp.]
MKNLFFLTFIILFSCSDSNDDNTNQLFREVNNNTFWLNVQDEFNYGNIISFSPDKLFYEFYQDGDFVECLYWEESNWTNVDYDGCVYETVSYQVVNESKTTLTVQDTTTGTNGCSNTTVTIIFEIINENTLTVKHINTWSGGQDEFTVTGQRMNSGFSYGNCIDGGVNNYLW